MNFNIDENQYFKNNKNHVYEDNNNNIKYSVHTPFIRSLFHSIFDINIENPIVDPIPEKEKKYNDEKPKQLYSSYNIIDLDKEIKPILIKTNYNYLYIGLLILFIFIIKRKK